MYFEALYKNIIWYNWLLEMMTEKNVLEGAVWSLIILSWLRVGLKSSSILKMSWRSVVPGRVGVDIALADPGLHLMGLRPWLEMLLRLWRTAGQATWILTSDWWTQNHAVLWLVSVERWSWWSRFVRWRWTIALRVNILQWRGRSRKSTLGLLLVLGSSVLEPDLHLKQETHETTAANQLSIN